MEKQAFHVEWGRLKIVGRPVMTGATIGASQLLWVACRTSPCLVHVFQDSHLMCIWRFPADPSFLLFGSSACEEKAERSKVCRVSLLVITSDGGIWLLDCSEEKNATIGRPAKKRKEEGHEDLQTAVQEILVGEHDCKGLSSRVENWDSPGNSVSQSVLSQLYDQVGEPNALFGNAAVNTEFSECGPVRQAILKNSSSEVRWEKLSDGKFPRVHNSVKVKSVTREALLGNLPGALVATFGPTDLIALLDLSGSPKILRSSSRCLSWSTSQANCNSRDGRESGCLLFAYNGSHSRGDEQAGGSVALLSAKLFHKLFGSPKNTSSSYGILHGDTNGHVYSSLMCPELTLSCKRLLCDFSQQMVTILATPDIQSSGKKDIAEGSEQLSGITGARGHSLLIVGRLGKVVMITGVKETVSEGDCGPFWPSSRNFSCRSKYNTLSAKQLKEKKLDFCEWELACPITAASMIGPYRLCYCTGSEILFADLRENVNHVHILHPHSKTGDMASAEKKSSVPLSLMKLSKKLQSSISPDLAARGDFKEELLPHNVPLVDIVVGIAGKGTYGSVGSSRPLVALTSRGRLLGVELSNQSRSRAQSTPAGITKTWRCLQSRMEDRIQDLLQVVADVSHSTDVIKSHSAKITVALNELAKAIPIASEFSSGCMRRPDSSLLGEAQQGKLSSFLTVTDDSSVVVSPDKLSFGLQTGNFSPSSNFVARTVKIAVRLCNQSHRVLSPYWCLLLELRSGKPDPTETLHFSFPVNRGLGLPIGAESTHEVITHLPGKGFDPLLAYVYICHHHDSHNSIVKAEQSVLDSRETSFSRKPKSNVCFTVDSKSNKAQTSLACQEDKSEHLDSSQTSGAVCVVLSKYRIDIVSLMQVAPPQHGTGNRGSLKMAGGYANFSAFSTPVDHFSGSFSCKISLTCAEHTTYTIPKDPTQLWEDLHLEDLLPRGVISKTGQRVTISGLDAETLSICLERENGEMTCSSLSILLETSSLMLGSYLREAVFWRLRHGTKGLILQECSAWQPSGSPNAKHMSGNVGATAGQRDHTTIRNTADMLRESSGGVLKLSNTKETSKSIAEVLQRLKVITDLWNDVLRSTESVLFKSALDQTLIVIQDVVKAYRTCREDNQFPT